MLLVDRIARALAEQTLEPTAFEQFGTTALMDYFPGLTPITGGSDYGRDADIPGQDGVVTRLLATTAVDVEQNLRDGLASLARHRLAAIRVVIVTSQALSGARRLKLEEIATAGGATLLPSYDRSWVAAQLYKHPEWRKRLLGVSGNPSAVVRRPLELTTGIGGQLALRGRGEELQWLRDRIGKDLIVEGIPGIGKTRLLGELSEDVVFLEGGPESVLADDLRDGKPAAIVVDRVRAQGDEVRFLRRIREEEGLDFGLILTTWPDQTHDAAQMLPGSVGTLQLPRLERGEIHEVLEELGVGSYHVRGEIMNQAQGRVGWAITLAELARAGKVTEVLAGGALHDEVVRYLSGIGEREEAQGILACLALLGGVPDGDLGRLAQTLGIPQPRLAASILDSSRRGLVTSTYDGWRVGPEALRRALVARWFFTSPPHEDFDRVAGDWRDLTQQMLESVMGAAESGSIEARRRADEGVRELLEAYRTQAVAPPASILETYAQLDEAAASWAVDQIAAEVAKVAAGPPPRTTQYEEVLKIAVGRFQISRAIHLLLDLAVGDERGVGQTLDHPLRMIDDLASRLIPDVGFRPGDRFVLTEAACSWIDQGRSPARWRVFAHVAREVLSPDFQGQQPDLADPLRVGILSGVAPPRFMAQIVDRIWPAVLERLQAAPDETVASVLDGLSEWARAAWAQNGAWGTTIPDEEHSAAASTLGRFLADLESRCEKSAGLSLCFNDAARRGRVDRKLPIEEELEILSLGVERPDRHDAWEANGEKIRELAGRWAAEAPQAVMKRLSGYHAALRLSHHVGHPWISQALYELGQVVTNPDAWCAEAVNHGLGSESYGLMVAALEKKQ